MVHAADDVRLPARGRTGRLLDLGVLQERVLAAADLLAAEDLAVLSSLRGWRSATLAVEQPAEAIPR